MDQRNTPCSHQMLGLQSEQGFIHSHHNHYVLSAKIVDSTNQNLHPGLSASRFYGNHYNCFQNLNAVPYIGPSCAVPTNFYTTCMFPSSSSSVPSNLNEFGRDNQSVDGNRGFVKRKTAELPPVNQHHINKSASSSKSFEHLEYQERGNVHTAEGSHRSLGSRSDLVSLLPVSAYFVHPNYVLQAAHMGHPCHPAISNGACPNWNYNHPITNMQGTVDMTNRGIPAFPEPLSSLNGHVLMNVTPFHQCLSPAHPMQLRSYGHQVQMQAIPYPHPLNNLHPIGFSHFTGGLNSGSGFSNFHSNGELTYRPLQMHNATPDFSRGSVSILSDEDGAVMDISAFHPVENVIDQHQDMRLDVDEMSYEELLALEEQIGDVKTGLTEEYINTNLKTSVHNSRTISPPLEELARYSQHNEACIICQDEYLVDEIVGTLDCGHKYHGECIKEWLLVKNSCPICKKAAFVKDKSEG